MFTSLFARSGREGRLILFISYLLEAGVVLRALGYIAQPASQGPLIILLLSVYLILLTLAQLAPFRAQWQHHLYFTVQTALLAALLMLPPRFDFYAVLFFPLAAQALLNLPRRMGRVWIGIFASVWTIIFVATFGVSGLALSLFFLVGAIFFASFGVLTVQTLEANRRLEHYAGQVQELTLANERQRMARELHDTLAQGLAGLILQLEAADSHLARGNAQRAQTIIEQAMTRARATLTDARRAIDDLRANEDAPRDVADDVRAEAEHFRETTGIAITLEMEQLPALDANVQETILRAIREGLTNIARHAHARNVWIRVTFEGDAVCVTLGDDGIGFEAERAQASNGHYGLLGLQERAQLAGGELNVTSAEGNGTTIALRVPVDL